MRAVNLARTSVDLSGSYLVAIYRRKPDCDLLYSPGDRSRLAAGKEMLSIIYGGRGRDPDMETRPIDAWEAG